MSQVVSVIEALKNWRPTAGQGDGDFFELSSSFEDGLSASEIDDVWTHRPLPEDLREFWLCCKSARLFEDTAYGQWGLHLYSPEDSIQRTDMESTSRPDDFRDGDVVVGEFLGDQDLLILTAGRSGATGVLVALPLDPRQDWYDVGQNFGSFLNRYFSSDGEKYWE